MSDETVKTADIDLGIPEPEDGTRYKVTWENRRRMAWVSLYGLMFVTLLYTGVFVWWIEATPEDKLKHLSDLYFYYAMTMASVVLGYMGSTSLPHLWKR